MKQSIFIILLLYIAFSSAAENKCFQSSPSYIVFSSENFKHPVQQITVECWIKPNNFDEWKSPLSYITDNSITESGFAFAFFQEKLRFMLMTENMSGNEWNYNPGVDLQLNQWAHVAGTYDGESIKIFLNGELVESKTTSGNINWKYIRPNFYIGSFIDFNENNLFDGQIDEVRIWNTARSTKDIQNFRNKKLSGKEEGLLAYYSFDQDHTLFIQDFSKSKINGKLNIPAQEQVLVPSGAMVMPRINNLEIISASSFKVNWDTSESIFTYDYYVVELSKSKSFDRIIASEKTLKGELVLKDIVGGSAIYLRIKAYSKDIGFTAYSDVFEIPNFSTALSVIVTSMSDHTDKTRNKLVDYNILTTDYVGFPVRTKDIMFSFKLNNVNPENIASGMIVIKGPSRNYQAEFSKSSDVSLFDLKSGKYDIEVDWGAENGEEPLRIKLKMEIKPRFFEQVYVQILIVFLLLVFSYFILKNFKLISAQKLNELNTKVASKEAKDEWIDPIILEREALLIKEYIIKEQSFLDPKFNLKLLAEKLDMPHYQISKILNDYFKLNFNDFINEFRVHEFVRIIKQSKNKHRKNSAIAYQCGFYSESTFFRAFKKFMGKTPQQYIKDISDSKG